MTLVGVDLHTRDQSVAVLDTERPARCESVGSSMVATRWSSSTAAWADR
jgi:hypothetical protein